MIDMKIRNPVEHSEYARRLFFFVRLSFSLIVRRYYDTSG
jgi:hypothetical protein